MITRIESIIGKMENRAEVKKALNKSTSSLSRYTQGQGLTPEVLDDLADYSGMSVDWILGRKEPDTPANSPQRNEIKEAASQEDRRIRNLISKFREQASLSTKRHLATHIDFLLKVKVDE